MTTSIITGTIIDGSGTPVSGVTVYARLRPGPAARLSDGTSIASPAPTTTNVNGTYTFALEQQANVTPAGSWWELEEDRTDAQGGRTVTAINVGAANATVAQSKVTPLALLNNPSALTQAQGDSRYVPKGALWVNVVTDAGAVGDDATDNTTAVQAAIDAAGAGGTVYFPAPGTYRFGKVNAPSGITVLFHGATLKCSGVAPANVAAVVPWFKLGTPSGTGRYLFEGDVMDASLSTPLWSAAAGTSNYLIAIDARNFGSSDQAIGKLITRCDFANWNIANKHGVAINTFAIPDYSIQSPTFTNCDIGVHVTEPFTTSPVTGHMSNVTGVDCALAVLFFEGFGYCDVNGFSAHATGGSPSQGDGIIIWTSNAVTRITVTGGRCDNIRYPLNIGFGGANTLSNSKFQMVAKGCRGSFGLFQADSSCTFDLTADGCAIGGISGGTCFGSIECGIQDAASAGDRVRLTNPTVVNSANNAIAVGLPVDILGGRAHSTSDAAVYWNPSAPGGAQAASVIRSLRGYNPAGAVTTPTFPATTVAVTNGTAVDVTAYITNGTSDITQIAVGGVNTGFNIAASKWGTVRILAGQTFKATYAGGSPTWVWVGD